MICCQWNIEKGEDGGLDNAPMFTIGFELPLHIVLSVKCKTKQIKTSMVGMVCCICILKKIKWVRDGWARIASVSSSLAFFEIVFPVEHNVMNQTKQNEQNDKKKKPSTFNSFKEVFDCNALLNSRNPVSSISFPFQKKKML